MLVSKWGNSLAVRLPTAVVKALDLKVGDDIEVYVADDRQFGVFAPSSAESTCWRGFAPSADAFPPTSNSIGMRRMAV